MAAHKGCRGYARADAAVYHHTGLCSHKRQAQSSPAACLICLTGELQEIDALRLLLPLQAGSELCLDSDYRRGRLHEEACCTSHKCS